MKIPTPYSDTAQFSSIGGNNVAHSRRPIRVLHVFGAMNRGGAEVWLMNVLRSITREEYTFDFAVHTREPAAFDAEIRQAGSAILPISNPRSRPWSYGHRLSEILRTHGPYDIVHSHVHFFSGYILRIAARARIPVRIAHSHIDTRNLDTKAGILRKAYLHLMRGWIHRHATAGLACSSFAGASLFGENWRHDARWRILRYGIDVNRFAVKQDSATLRSQLGIPPKRQIVGQVGRLVEQKNHKFSIPVIRQLLRNGVDAHWLVVGAGELESQIRSQLQEAGLTERATLVGDQADVVPFYQLMNCMIFPSWNEGLPVTMLEAQAAGVAVIASDGISSEVVAIPEMVDQLPLRAGPEKWAATIARRLTVPVVQNRDASALFAETDFSIQRSTKQLCCLYDSFCSESV
jgi:glycosyltransferase involved in cell wall biosynthesis